MAQKDRVEVGSLAVLAHLKAVEKQGLEGIMAKRLDSSYSPGKRSPAWVKIKVAKQSEFDVIGMVPGAEIDAISSLALGTQYRGRWLYKGNVGSGLTESQRRDFHMRITASPSLKKPPADGPKDVVWRNSGLRCTVRYFEKTTQGKLRGPVFLGLVE